MKKKSELNIVIFSFSFARRLRYIAGNSFFSSPPTTVFGPLGERDRVRGRMALDSHHSFGGVSSGRAASKASREHQMAIGVANSSLEQYSRKRRNPSGN
jgi:hypothetical protein